MRKRNYLIGLLVLILCNLLLIFFDRGQQDIIFDENSQNIEVVHCETGEDSQTFYVYYLHKDSILFKCNITDNSDWGIIAKNDYYHEDVQINLLDYDSVSIRLKSLGQDNEIIMLGIRTYHPNAKVEKSKINPGIMWRKLIPISDSNSYITYTNDFTDFEGYEFDPQNQDFFRQLISVNYSNTIAMHDNKVILAEIIIQPFGNIKVI